MKVSNIIGTGFVFLIIMLSFFKLEGFGNPLGGMMKEIEENNFVDVIGIDLVNSDDKLMVTVGFSDLEAKSQRGTGKQESTKNDRVLSAEGRTVFEAHRNLHLLSPKNFSYGHFGWLLIGEDAAHDNLTDYLDFELRDFERGWSGKVAIIKDATAKQFLTEVSKTDEPVYKMITGLRKASDNLSISGEVTLSDTMEYLNRKNPTYCFPYFIINTARAEKGESAGEPVMSGGLAVIKDNKLFGFLSRELSRGVNWITGKIKSASITVKNSYNQNCSLEIIGSHSVIKTYFNGEMPVADIHITVKSLINELPAVKNIQADVLIKELEKAQGEYVKAEAEAALKYSQVNGADILGIGDSIYHQHPFKWKPIEKTWNNVFPKMKVSIHIESSIAAEGLFRDYMIEGEGK